MKKPDPQIVPVILDSITEGVFTVNEDLRINFFNRAAEKIIGFPREEAIGKYCYEIFRTNLCHSRCSLKRTLDTMESFTDVEVDALSWDGKNVPICVSTSVLRDKSGKSIGAVETFRDLSAIKVLRDEIAGSHSFEEIISKNYRMQEIFRIIPDVAATNATVLVQGPSGAGKEIMVRAIHNLSERKDKPFVKVNCGAIPDTLLESELFGYVRGAFTDAKKDKPGRFSLADGGTIFLDEIGDISPALQVKLLRVLQEKEFEPLGSNTTIKADVRVIAATNQDLQRLVLDGMYRNDLYYRLKVMSIDIPSLSERREDIPLLVEHFVDRFNKKTNKHISRASDRVIETLMKYPFPGNIRELENIIEHGFILCKNGILELRHLPKELTEIAVANTPQTLVSDGPLQEAEAKTIAKLLKNYGGNRTKTAAALGINRTTLWRKMKCYGIDINNLDRAL